MNAPGRTLKSTWSVAGTSIQKEKPNESESKYEYETYRKDVFMLYTNKMGKHTSHKMSDLLNGIKNAGVLPKDILGIQTKNTGLEIMCRTEEAYDKLLEDGVDILEETIDFKPKRKRRQAVKVIGLSMDVFDAHLEEVLSAYGEIVDGKQHQISRKSEDEEWNHVSNGDRIVYMVIEKSIPRRLMIRNEWVTTWYVGQVKSCNQCGEDHRTQDCKRTRCYGCNKMGHIATNCPENKEKEGDGTSQNNDEMNGRNKNEGSKTDDLFGIETEEIHSPEYSPIKEGRKEEVWTEEEVNTTIVNKDISTLFTKKETNEMMKKLEKETPQEIKEESKRLTQTMTPRKATMMFVSRKKELNEIKQNKALNPEDRKKVIEDNRRWLYGTLNIMRNESIAGFQQDTSVKFKTKDNGERKRSSEEISPQSSNRKNRKNSS